MIFSKRREVAKQALSWCIDNGASQDAFGLITAMDALGFLASPLPGDGGLREALYGIRLLLHSMIASELRSYGMAAMRRCAEDALVEIDAALARPAKTQGDAK